MIGVLISLVLWAQAAGVQARHQNEANAELRSAIGVLLETETYRIYFRRFTNITAEQLRDLLLDLPYRKRSAPASALPSDRIRSTR